MQVSLQALKAFESAARHGSFKTAAEELSLTPTAVSHHVRNLEDRLSVSLFHRVGRRISLTETGRRLAKATSEGFGVIDHALDEVMKVGSAVKVTTTSSLAALVLIPSQTEFEEANPGVSLEIATGESIDNQSYVLPIRLGDRARVDDADVISFESFDMFGASGMPQPTWTDKNVTVFTTEWKNKSLPPPPLAAWLAENGLSATNIKLKKYDQELFGIQQAMAENGLVFCSTTLTKQLLKSKLLKRFKTRPVHSDLCYYVPAKASFESRGATRFLEWIEKLLA